MKLAHLDDAHEDVFFFFYLAGYKLITDKIQIIFPLLISAIVSRKI